MTDARSTAAVLEVARARVALRTRLGWLVLFAGPLTVVILAALLHPDPAGVGTHQQLGLPPCGFLFVTGYPCPACGLTTAFAHMVRAEFIGAALANPFGILLFLVTVAIIPVAGLGLVRGWPVFETLDRLQFEKWALLLVVTSLLVWVTKLCTLYFGL